MDPSKFFLFAINIFLFCEKPNHGRIQFDHDSVLFLDSGEQLGNTKIKGRNRWSSRAHLGFYWLWNFVVIHRIPTKLQGKKSQGRAKRS